MSELTGKNKFPLEVDTIAETKWNVQSGDDWKNQPLVVISDCFYF